MDSGNNQHVQGSSESCRGSDDRLLAEAQLQTQNELLAKIARGEPLAEILNATIAAIERSLEEAFCSILILDRNHRLCHGAAPSLPDSYNQAINGALVTDDIGPCARAVFRQETVIAPDLAAASFLQRYQDLALNHNLRACWSIPIFGRDGQVLGTFATYYQTVRSPQAYELATIAQMADLTGIAIERQQAEERLRHSEAMLLEAQQVAHVGSWSFDILTQTITWSPEMFRIYGLEPTATAPSYPEYLQFLQAEDRQRLQRYVERAITEGRPYTIEYSLVRPDATASHLECRAEVERDAHGQVTRLFGTALDITERKTAELALQNLVAGTAALTGRDFFPALVRHIAEALQASHVFVTEIVSSDRLHFLAAWGDGHYLPNDTVEIAGTTCAIAIQTGAYHCDRDVIARFPQNPRLAPMGVESYMGIALQNRHGQAFGTLCIFTRQPIAAPERAEQILRVFGARAAAELERQQAETAVKQQLAATEAAIDGISILKDGAYLYANPAHLSLFGYEFAGDLLGQPWSTLYAPTEAQRLEQDVLPRLERERTWRGEAIATRKDGSTFTEEVSLTLTEDELLIQVCRDISDRKQAETAFKNLITGTAATTGADFFPALTRHIAAALQVSYAIVSEYSDDQLCMLAFWANGMMQPNLVYNPAKTPCELTLQKGRFYCGHSVQQQFPNDPDLVRMNADSYLGIVLQDSQGRPIGDLCILHQEAIPDPHRAEQILQVFAARAAAEVERQRSGAASKRQLAAMEAAIDGISILQGDRHIYVNQAYLDLFGYEQAEALLGQSWRRLYSSDEMTRLEQQVFPNLQRERSWQGEAIATRKDSSTFAQGLSLTLTEDNLLILVCRDVSDLKQAQALIAHNALHDPLTDLPNRTLLLERLDLAINRTKRLKHHRYAVLFLDLDRFKVINDSLGHTVGDRLLIAIAQRLEQTLGETDLVARLGGDEFLILLEDFRSPEEVVSIAERILADSQVPLNVDGHQIFTSMSIGIALGNKNYQHAGELIRDADIAMYRAKTQESNSYKFFDATMHIQAIKRMTLEADLRTALECQEFTVRYQPIVDLLSYHLVGFEALVRWQHPTRGVIAPQEFIPIAEETGIIVTLDRWILEEACQQLGCWQAQYDRCSPLKVSVNLSAQDLRKANLIQDIDDILQKTGLAGGSIMLEITESMLIEDIDQTIELLAQLAARKIRISIDDFGTGYSSLNYLHRLPVNSLKIDQSFVSQMQSESRKHQVVSTIVTLSSQLGLTAVAEGIETQQQLQNLQALGCNFGQGYLFSKPLPASEIEARFFQPNALEVQPNSA